MLWRIEWFPLCEWHVFLSHCQEDRDTLVLPLCRELQSRHVVPWLDRHDYPYGRTSFEALRDSVLKCRHCVFLITRAMLAQPRGWSVVELAWADLLQANLHGPGGALQNVALPLFFVEPTNGMVPRSAWRTLSDRGAFHKDGDGDPVTWARDRILEFILREQRRGQDLAKGLEGYRRERSRLGLRRGLLDRITCRHPAMLLPR